MRAKMADARLVIIGSGAEADSLLPALGSECELCRFVDDLAPWYRSARVVCCPIYHGSGTRVKIIEAAAYAKAIVSTRLGAEGLEFEDGREIILRDTPETLGDACMQLLQTRAALSDLGRAAHARAAELVRARRYRATTGAHFFDCWR